MGRAVVERATASGEVEDEAVMDRGFFFFFFFLAIVGAGHDDDDYDANDGYRLSSLLVLCTGGGGGDQQFRKVEEIKSWRNERSNCIDILP